MAVKFIKTIIISKANGKAKEVSFPVDEGFLKAISTLSEEDQASYLTSAYYDYKREQKRKRRILSFECMLEDNTEFQDGLVDSNPNPEELCLRNERYEFLRQAIETLNERQRRVITELFYNGKTQRELAEEMDMTEQAMSMFVAYVLAKLRKFLEGKI